MLRPASNNMKRSASGDGSIAKKKKLKKREKGTDLFFFRRPCGSALRIVFEQFSPFDSTTGSKAGERRSGIAGGGHAPTWPDSARQYCAGLMHAGNMPRRPTPVRRWSEVWVGAGRLGVRPRRAVCKTLNNAARSALTFGKCAGGRNNRSGTAPSTGKNAHQCGSAPCRQSKRRAAPPPGRLEEAPRNRLFLRIFFEFPASVCRSQRRAQATFGRFPSR